MTFHPRPRFTLPLPNRRPLELGARTLVMGVVNVTPDSFSDGGALLDPIKAVDAAVRLADEGADIIDIGGESTRPGAAAVGAAEERARVLPVVEAVLRRVAVPVSVDTSKASVAEAVLQAGAAIINDVSGLRYDPALGATVARHGAALVLMHMRGRPQDMYRHATYHDVLAEVLDELRESIAFAVNAGVAREALIVDPGLGFAKEAAHTYEALARLHELAGLGRPILSGPSRKSFLAHGAGPRLPAAERDWATAAAVAQSVLAGAHIVRVHAVAPMREVVRVADEIRKYHRDE